MKSKRTKRKRVERVHHRIEGLPDRLRLAFESYGTVTAAATAIDRSEGALRKWIRGESEPSASDLRSICEVIGVRIEWLIFDEGSPTRISAKSAGTGGKDV